jgi:hypothetical protein
MPTETREDEALQIEIFTMLKFMEIAFPGDRGQKAAVQPCPTRPRSTASQIQVPLWKFSRDLLPRFLGQEF